MSSDTAEFIARDEIAEIHQLYKRHVRDRRVTRVIDLMSKVDFRSEEEVQTWFDTFKGTLRLIGYEHRLTAEPESPAPPKRTDEQRMQSRTRAARAVGRTAQQEQEQA